MNTEQIARICHETNRAYCQSIGDDSQKSWEEAEQWQRDSAIKGVNLLLANSEMTPKLQHIAWCQEKLDAGWSYGPFKDVARKEHPCLITYEALPLAQKIKDFLFQGIVRAFMNAS